MYYNTSSIEKPEVRKIQAIHGETTFVLVIPKDFAEITNSQRRLRENIVSCSTVFPGEVF